MGTALLSFEHKSPQPKQARMLPLPGGHLIIHSDSTSTGGQFSLVEIEAGPGAEPPLHVHRNEDEMFYVLEGTLTVVRGFEEIALRAGESGFLPRNVPHTFKINSKHARFLVFITPGGFEGYFRAMAEMTSPLDIPERMRIAAHYGVTFLP